MKNLLSLATLLLALNNPSQAADSSTYFFNKGVQEKNAKHFLVASKNFDCAVRYNLKFVQAYIENGYANLEMRKTDAAIENFAKAYALEPNNSIALKELMNLYFSYHQYDKAIAFAQKCTNCDNAQRIMALSYFNQEDYARASKILLEILAKNAKDAEANYTLGRSYLEMEQEKNAIVYYEKAVHIDTTKSAWLHELALLYYTTNNYKSAVINFNKAAAAGFNQTNDFKENLGFAYIYAGDFTTGEKILLEISAKKSGSKELLRDMAQAYFDKKMYDKCLDFCQKLLEMDMKDGEALYQAGMCFQRKGEKEKGQAMCDKAIELTPSLAKNKKQQMMPGAGL